MTPARQHAALAPARGRATVGVGMLLAGLAAVHAAEAAPAPGMAAADAAVAEAHAALDHGDLQSAKDAVRRALVQHPGHPEATRLDALLGRAAAPDPASAQAIAAAGTAAALNRALDDARFLLAGGRSHEAAQVVIQAIAAAGDRADPAALAQARGVLAEAERLAGQAAADERQAVGLAAAAAAARSDADTRSGTSLRNERLARIHDLRRRNHLELALANCRRLLTDLPADAEVEELFRELLDAAHDQRRATLAEREAELRLEVAARVERSLIPEGVDGMPIYPADWDRRRSGRSGVLESPLQVPEWKLALQDRLEQRVSIELDASPAGEALQLLARIGNINLLVDPEISAGDKTVTLKVAGMRLGDVIAWATRQVGTRWTLNEGAVYVGEHAKPSQITAIHDIAALVVAARDFPGPTIAFANTAGSGQSLLTPAVDDVAPAQSADDIVERIRRSVSPASWSDDGNTIAIQGTMLVVTASDDVHQLIREFLRAQTEQNSLAVHVDVRWIEVNDLYLEEIGVQWRSTSGDLVASGINDRNGGGFLRSVNGWSVDGGTVNSMPASSLRVRNADTDGLTLQAALIGGSSFSAILNACERGTQGRVLMSPELTCLNGQRAHTYFGQMASFISDYTIQSSYYDPVISTIPTGVVLDIHPLVSADRRYVTMDLRTSTSTVSFFTDVITTLITYGGNNQHVPNGGNGTGTVDDNEQPPVWYSQSFPIELPNVSLRETQTRVMLPDKGSLLVGGFNSSTDQFTASRVPMLGSIPFLGRLFGARGRYSEQSKLYILSTVSIINYPELEARL